MARKWGVKVAVAAFFAVVGLAVVSAGPPSGAIFTTLPDGSEVNYNIYDSKYDVYLDGGPGMGAPQTAAGLDDGIYVFQVTDPSGKVLLSEDNAACRRFTVENGIITGVVAAGGCEHETGLDIDHDAVTVQLMPYKDTPNPGGEYKVWVTGIEEFLMACPDGLDVVDCTGGRLKGVAHGFIPKYSKTDNFKVGGYPREIDTRFHYKDLDGPYIDGLWIVWTDTLGASNAKYSYLNTALDINHEAHVEDVENGTHRIAIANQPGCMVGAIRAGRSILPKQGPQTVSVTARSGDIGTFFIDVQCK